MSNSKVKILKKRVKRLELHTQELNEKMHYLKAHLKTSLGNIRGLQSDTSKKDTKHLFEFLLEFLDSY